MATYTVNVSYFSGSANFNFSQISGGAGANASNPIDLQEGDVLQFSCVKAPTDPAMTIKTFSSAYWTSTADILFTSSGSNSRTVKTNPTLSASSVGVYTGGNLDDVCYFNVVSSVDTLPDSIDGDLGTNITNANVSQVYEFAGVEITGINNDVTSSVSGDGTPEQKKNTGGTWGTGNITTVENGDVIYVRTTSSASYNTAHTVTLKVGGNVSGTLNTDYVQDQITVTTLVDPLTGTRIPFTPSSGTISMNDISKFHGPGDGLQASLGNYYRGGSYIIDTTTGSPNNSGVPTSGSIDIDDFYNSFTTLYFTTAPSNQSINLDTSTTSQTGQMDWSRSAGDWAVGYSPTMYGSVDYRITHEVTQWAGQAGMAAKITQYDFTFAGTTTDLTNTANHSSFTSAWTTSTNPSIVVDLAVNVSTEFFITGKVTLEMRHKVQTSYTFSSDFYYNVFIFGP